MSQWREIRLKNTILSSKNGVWGDDPDGKNDVMVIRVADFDRDTLRVKEAPTLRSVSQKELKDRVVNFGDLIIEKSGGGDKQPVGTVVSSDIDEPCTCSNFLAKLSTRPEFYNRYLVYLHSSVYKGGKLLSAIKQTTGIQNLDLEDYLNIEVKVPPLETQTKIAKYLDRKTAELDQLIAAKKNLLKLLDEKKRALITRAVTRGQNLDVPLQESGIPWLGMIPEHWEVERSKWLLPEIDERSETGEEELLTVSHLTGVTKRSDKDVNMFMAESLEGYKKCSKDDLVINTLWAWMGAMGVSPVDGVISPAYNVYRPTERILPEYLDMLVRMPNFVSEITRYSKGVWSSRLRLYPEGLYEAYLPVPPIAEQLDIVDGVNNQLSQYKELKSVTEKTIKLLQERRTALISAAVTGKLSEEELDAG